MSEKRNGLEVGNPRAVPEVSAAAKPLNSVLESSGHRPQWRTPQQAKAADVLEDVWVLVVCVGAGHYRRRVFLSVGPAWQAARRAQDRGYSSEVVLCRLEPVGGVPR